MRIAAIAYRYLRMLFPEAKDNIRKEKTRQRNMAVNIHLLKCIERRQFLPAMAQLSYLLGIQQHPLARLRHADTAAGTIQQLNADFLFQALQ